MPSISAMSPPSLPLSGLELLPCLQGGGADANFSVPLAALRDAPSGAVLTLRVPMVADLSATTDADPGAANVRWNNAAPGSATVLYVNDADGDSGDLAAVFATLNTGGYLYLQGAADSAARDNWQKWQVTSVTDATGYTKVAVTLQSSAGSFTDDDALELTVQQPTPSPGVDRNVVTTVSSSSGTTTLDASLGDYFKTTLSENTTIAVSNFPTCCTLHLQLSQAASYAVTWPGTWNWGAGVTAPTMPTGAGKVLDVMVTTNDAGGACIATARERA